MWRTVRRELAASWRSLRYDLRGVRDPQRARDPQGTGDQHRPDGATAVIAPAVTGTDEDYPEYEAYRRRPRRVRTGAVVGALAIGAAAATYFGVVGSLSTLLADDSPPPGALPGVSVERDPAGPPRSAVGSATGPAATPTSTTDPARQSETAGPARPGEPDETRPGRPEAAPRPGTTQQPPATRKPPVPTPAPDPSHGCGCPDPDPTSTGSPGPTPTPTGTGSPTPTFTPSPAAPAPDEPAQGTGASVS